MEVTSINSEKLQKIESDIAKMKSKISDYTARLKELERQKTEVENAGIIALVRDMDVLPDELSAFIRAFKEQSGVGLPAPIATMGIPPTQNDKEDEDIDS
jgi:septal ring factor EnvC (AmiA/AmiB activator)